MTLQDLTDSSLLGTGEHGAAIVVDPPYVSQWPSILLGRGLILPDQPLVTALEHLSPRLEAVGGEPTRREHELLAVDEFIEHVPAHA